jgi:hypothetical protein
MGEKEKTPSTLATPLPSPGHAGQTFMQISYRQKLIKLTKTNLGYSRVLIPGFSSVSK